MNKFWLLVAMLTVTASASADSLRSFRPGNWQTMRQMHQGHPTIIHFWGLTCGPCLVELPQWRAITQAHPELALITVAADPTPMPRAALAATLDKAGLARAENWIFDAMAERLRWEIDPEWQGELPMTILIAADGSIRTTLGAIDMKDVEAWLSAQAHQ
jgi:thiol-disulfide isomerase/thioredoxin